MFITAFVVEIKFVFTLRNSGLAKTGLFAMALHKYMNPEWHLSAISGAKVVQCHGIVIVNINHSAYLIYIDTDCSITFTFLRDMHVYILYNTITAIDNF